MSDLEFLFIYLITVLFLFLWTLSSCLFSYWIAGCFFSSVSRRCLYICLWYELKMLGVCHLSSIFVYCICYYWKLFGFLCRQIYLQSQVYKAISLCFLLVFLCFLFFFLSPEDALGSHFSQMLNSWILKSDVIETQIIIIEQIKFWNTEVILKKNFKTLQFHYKILIVIYGKFDSLRQEW